MATDRYWPVAAHDDSNSSGRCCQFKSGLLPTGVFAWAVAVRPLLLAISAPRLPYASCMIIKMAVLIIDCYSGMAIPAWRS